VAFLSAIFEWKTRPERKKVVLSVAVRLVAFHSLRAEWWNHHVQGGMESQDALSCRSFSAKEPLIKRATNRRAPLRKMTYKDKASYRSSPPCTTIPRALLYFLGVENQIDHFFSFSFKLRFKVGIFFKTDLRESRKRDLFCVLLHGSFKTLREKNNQLIVELPHAKSRY